MPPTSDSAATRDAPAPARFANLGDRAWRWGLSILGGTILVVAGLILLELGRVARPAWEGMNVLRFLTSTDWDPVQEKFGALPFVYGTLVTSAVAILVALPVSVGLALFLSEMDPGGCDPPLRTPSRSWRPSPA